MMRWGVLGESSQPIQLTRRDWQLGFGFASVLLLITLASTYLPTACGSYHDDAIYVATAKSLVEGTGYSLINLPGSPPQTKYPILYPLLLAGIWKLWPTFPANLWAIQGLTMLSAALAVGLGFLFLIRFAYASRGVAAAVTALVITTPFFQFISTRALSEMPFAFLLVLALWRVESALRAAHSTAGAQFLTGVVIALAYLCRSVGVVVAVAALIALVARRRPVWLTLLGFATAAGPWVYWSLTALGQWQQNNVLGYYTDYLGSWTILASYPSEIVGWNLLYLLVATLATSMIGLHLCADWLLGWKLGPIFLTLGGLPWLYIVWRSVRFQMLPMFLAGYGMLMLCWPWPPARFLLPVLPFVLLYVVQIARRVTSLVLPTLHPFILKGGLALALAANLVVTLQVGLLYRETNFPFPTFPDRPVHWRSYEAVFDWIRQNTAATDRVGSALDTMVFLYTGRQAIRPFRYSPERLFYGVPGSKSGAAEEVFKSLADNGVRFLTLFPIPGYAAETSIGEVVAEMRRRHPDRLFVRYVAPDPRFVVFEVR
jgi:hypothetical protein